MGKMESEIFRFDLFLGLRPIDMESTMELKNIFYSLNSWELNSSSKTECEILVELLSNNPTISIELQSHTDSRGSDSFNKELSQKRAQSVVDYVVSRGIARSRLVPKGYGETRLRNHCSNDILCPDKLHQQNRRTEFVIIGQ
jgi:outer membrane protein OmpA-like peptidoglycan-associated protein